MLTSGGKGCALALLARGEAARGEAARGEAVLGEEGPARSRACIVCV